MKADAQFAAQRVGYGDKKLCVKGVDGAVAPYKRGEGLSRINYRLVQPKAYPDSFDGLLGQAGVFDARFGWIAGQNTKQKEVEYNDKNYGEKCPSDFFDDIFVHQILPK
jgi:hypothetical protein